MSSKAPPGHLCTSNAPQKETSLTKYRQPKLPLEEILSPMWQNGQSGWESSDAHCLPGTARAARAAPQAQPTPAGRLWGSAQSPLLMLSHPSHSCASDAKVPVPREGNPSCSRNRPTYVVPGDASEAPKPKKKGLFLSLSQSTRHLSPPASLPANGRELLSFFSRLSQPKGTSEASGRSWGSRMGGCEHPPGHKEAAGEEDAPALPCEAGHRNGQRGKGSLLTARGSCALPKSPACS